MFASLPLSDCLTFQNLSYRKNLIFKFLPLFLILAQIILITHSSHAQWSSGDSEYWPEYAYNNGDQRNLNAAEKIFTFIKDSLGPLIFVISGLAALGAMAIGKYRHAVGLALVTLVAISLRYLISIVTSGGGAIFLLICFSLVVLVKFLWTSPDKESKDGSNGKADAIFGKGKASLSSSSSRQRLAAPGALPAMNSKANYATSGFTKGFTGSNGRL
ncbi:MAG: hypothetical protein SGJ02_11600 [bacterium]|nr:hypothetical protein [bacterium]